MTGHKLPSVGLPHEGVRLQHRRRERTTVDTRDQPIGDDRGITIDANFVVGRRARRGLLGPRPDIRQVCRLGGHDTSSAHVGEIIGEHRLENAWIPLQVSRTPTLDKLYQRSFNLILRESGNRKQAS